jgi:hypothetical protein
MMGRTTSLRRGLSGALVAAAMTSMALGCQRTESDVEREASSEPSILYLVEIVSNDVDALTELYQDLHGLSFGPPDPDLGQARVATRADGTLVGIRAPLADHDTPIVWTYFGLGGAAGDVRHRVSGRSSTRRLATLIASRAG